MDEPLPPKSDSSEPTASSEPGASVTSVGKRAAIFSLWWLFAGLFVLLVLNVATENQDPMGSRGAIATGGIFSLFFAGGLALGIKGLRRMKVEGRKGIMGRALTGMVLNGLLFCVMMLVTGLGVWGLVLTAKEKEQAAASAQEIKEQEALRDKAAKEFTLKVEELEKKYLSSGQALAGDPSSAKSRAELKAREERLGDFIAACKAKQNLAEHGTELYKQELLKHNVQRWLLDASVKGFAKSFSSASNPQSIDLRKADVQRGEAMLKIVTVLDGAWGQWEYDPAKHKIEFKDPAHAAEFNKAVEEFNQVNKESLRLKQQIPEMNPSAQAGS